MRDLLPAIPILFSALFFSPQNGLFVVACGVFILKTNIWFTCDRKVFCISWPIDVHEILEAGRRRQSDGYLRVVRSKSNIELFYAICLEHSIEHSSLSHTVLCAIWKKCSSLSFFLSVFPFRLSTSLHLYACYLLQSVSSISKLNCTLRSIVFAPNMRKIINKHSWFSILLSLSVLHSQCT